MKMKPAIRSPGPQKARAHALRISAPAGDPARDIAERVGGEQQVHARRAARQLLLPHRDLVVLGPAPRSARRAARHNGRTRRSFSMLGRRRARVFLARAPGGAGPRSASRWSSATVTNRHGVELAVIGRARGDGQDALQLLGASGPGPTSSRGFAERRVSSSDRIEERSLSIDAGASRRRRAVVQQSASQARICPLRSPCAGC